MLKPWTILLLCGLLPFQEAVAQVVRLDKVEVEKILSNHLASSDLLQGGSLLKPIGDLLGGQGEGLLGSVGSLLGGQRGLLDLKIVNIVLPNVTLKLLPGVGIGVNIFTKVELKGKTLLSGPLDTLVLVNITASARFVKDASGAHKLVVENCKTSLVEIKILSGSLLGKLGDILSNLLNNLFPKVLCPLADIVVGVLDTVVGTVDSVLPLGALGKVHYILDELPLFHGEGIVLNLNLAVTDNEGNTVNLPPAELPSLPPVGDHASQLFLSSNILSSLLEMLLSNGGLEVDLTEQVLSGAVPMTTSALQSLLPEVSELLSGDLPLEVKVRIHGTPAVSLQDEKVTVALTAVIEVSARRGSGLTPLFAVNADIKLVGDPTIAGSKLGVTVDLERDLQVLPDIRSLSASLARQIETANTRRNFCSLRLASSEIGSFDADLLENWASDLISAGLLPVVKGVLQGGIPLPKFFDMGYVSGAVSTVENTIVAPLVPQHH